MSKTIIYHHDDPDGILAGAIVNSNVTGEKVFISSHYGMDIDWNNIDVDDTVYVVDFSFGPHDMMQMALMAENVIWIDHHVSAIKAWEENMAQIKKEFNPNVKDIDGIREVGKSGCELTEKYFNRILPKWRENAENSELVELIGTYDTWRKDNKFIPFEIAYNCMVGFLGRNLKPNSPELEAYFDMVYNPGLCELTNDLIHSLIKEGETINTYLKNFQNKRMEESSFETQLFGYKCLALNTPIKGSGQIIDRYNSEDFDMMCVFFFNGRRWEYSFYTEKNIDMSFIAKNLAKDDTGIGGGHRGAAGCCLTKNIFRHIAEEDIMNMPCTI